MSDKSQYICIEGNIGAGKTSLCYLMQKRDGCKLILEEFADNPFLSYFYNDPTRYALTVELFFLTERHKQLKNDLLHRDLFSNYLLSDYCLVKSLLFARTNLKDDAEYNLYTKLYNSLSTDFRKPDKIVYLHQSIDKIIQQINARGRSYEMSITKEYLKSIEEMYFNFFYTSNDISCLILDCENIDFIKSESDFEQIYHLIKKDYSTGLHHIKIN